MTPMPRTKVLVQVRLQTRERDRWLRAATMEHLRLGELVRLAVRNHVKEVETLRLLARESSPSRPSSAA
jgi:hypothetical protein